MTKVDFYFNVAHKSQKIVQLGKVALAKKLTLTVHLSGKTFAKEMSDYLWAHDPISFLPHRFNDDSVMNAPILLDWQGQSLPYDDILVNMTSHTPHFFSRFQKVIEIVSLEELDKAAARKRFKFYRDRGYEINSIDALK